ncbi:MAG TPA: AsmA family protein [Rhodocyclaceae bacterium]
MASEVERAGRRATALKAAGIALAVAAFVVAAVIVFANSRLFAAAVEGELARVTLAQTGRTLAFRGPLEVFFWPNAGFRVGRVSLSEPGAKQEFASLESARLSVAAAPLLQGQISIGECIIEGLQARIVRHRDGSLNIDDLLPSGKSSASAYRIDLAGASLSGARIEWLDEAGGAPIAVSGIDFASGRLLADTGARTLSADKLSLGASVGELRARVELGGVSASPTALAAQRLHTEAHYHAGETGVDATLEAKPAVDAQRGSLSLDDLAGKIDIAHARLAHPIALPLRGALHAGPDAADGKLAATLDGSTAKLSFRFTRTRPPAVNFEMDVDRIDAARYLAPEEDGAPTPAGTASSASVAGLPDIAIDGVARIGALAFGGITTRNLRLEVHGRGGALDLRTAAGK